MPDVALSASVDQRIALLARAWGIKKGDVIERLLDDFQRGGPGSDQVASPAHVQVHAVYGSTRVEGLFDPVNHSLQITTGSLAGKTYRSPSGAAIAVVSLHNRGVSPNRNGWNFWHDTETGKLLQALRGTR